MKIWQVYASTHVDMTTRLNLHVGCRFDIDHWRVVWMSVQQPQTYWNVVSTSWQNTELDSSNQLVFHHH